jgi:hypothetical protein
VVVDAGTKGAKFCVAEMLTLVVGRTAAALELEVGVSFAAREEEEEGGWREDVLLLSIFCEALEGVAVSRIEGSEGVGCTLIGTWAVPDAALRTS